MFVFHIANLDSSSLARQFYNSQKANHPALPSVVHEVEDFFSEWNMADYQNLTKTQFRKKLKKILYEKNRSELLQWTKSYKKVNYDKCMKEKFELKSYFKTMNIA